jgi:hypothetical protein
MRRNLFAFLIFMSGISLSCASDSCEGCWEPKLNFDIGDKGFESSLIFISGQSYALTASNRNLQAQGKENYFCKDGDIGSKVLVDILNEGLSGTVTAEDVTRVIAVGLRLKYPCILE